MHKMAVGFKMAPQFFKFIGGLVGWDITFQITNYTISA